MKLTPSEEAMIRTAVLREWWKLTAEFSKPPLRDADQTDADVDAMAEESLLDELETVARGVIGKARAMTAPQTGRTVVGAGEPDEIVCTHCGVTTPDDGSPCESCNRFPNYPNEDSAEYDENGKEV